MLAHFRCIRASVRLSDLATVPPTHLRWVIDPKVLVREIYLFDIFFYEVFRPIEMSMKHLKSP